LLLILGYCDCPSIYPAYKNATVTTPYYHPYLYTFYRQQAAWRQSLKGTLYLITIRKLRCMPTIQPIDHVNKSVAYHANMHGKGTVGTLLQINEFLSSLQILLEQLLLSCSTIVRPSNFVSFTNALKNKAV
jgi:hypothetical protein